MIYPQRQRFNFDTAIRYLPIVKNMEKTKWKKYPVLEAGSGGSGISDYFEGKVVGVDTDFSKTGTEKNQNIRHVKGSILRLPFKNNSFYTVVCMDTLEHIEKDKRKKAISEMLRVTKKGGQIYLGFPSGDKSIDMENRVNGLYKKAYGRNHLWLLEHKKCGLPSVEEVGQILENLGLKSHQYKLFFNANLLCWFFIHLLFTIYPGKIFSRAIKFLYRIFFPVFSINLPPYYRAIFTIIK